jgi:hypothetical protein
MPDIPLALLIALLSAIASFFGAWLAAHFALRHFYKERIWERKVAAYSAIFEALHIIERWYDQHFDAYVEQRDLSSETTTKLKKDANEAEEALERRLASETWLIPEECRLHLNSLTAKLKNRPVDWFTYLDDALGVLTKGTDHLRTLVQKDLGLKS